MGNILDPKRPKREEANEKMENRTKEPNEIRYKMQKIEGRDHEGKQEQVKQKSKTVDGQIQTSTETRNKKDRKNPKIDASETDYIERSTALKNVERKKNERTLKSVIFDDKKQTLPQTRSHNENFEVDNKETESIQVWDENKNVSRRKNSEKKQNSKVQPQVPHENLEDKSSETRSIRNRNGNENELIRNYRGNNEKLKKKNRNGMSSGEKNDENLKFNFGESECDENKNVLRSNKEGKSKQLQESDPISETFDDTNHIRVQVQNEYNYEDLKVKATETPLEQSEHENKEQNPDKMENARKTEKQGMNEKPSTEKLEANLEEENLETLKENSKRGMIEKLKMENDSSSNLEDENSGISDSEDIQTYETQSKAYSASESLNSKAAAQESFNKIDGDNKNFCEFEEPFLTKNKKEDADKFKDTEIINSNDAGNKVEDENEDQEREQEKRLRAETNISLDVKDIFGKEKTQDKENQCNDQTHKKKRTPHFSANGKKKPKAPPPPPPSWKPPAGNDLGRQHKSLNYGFNSRGMESNTVTPNKIILKWPCPCSGTTSSSLYWNCKNCDTILEYGCDNYIYCSNCGRGKIEDFQFECTSSNHVGRSGLNLSIDEPLEKKFKPLEEMNILFLGQSGVGKSTWINSIVNYFRYESFYEAEKKELLSVIPASFTITYIHDDDIKKQLIEVGESDPNEVTRTGSSATQEPQTYKFQLGNKLIRIIDTPGLGDSEGLDKDKKNMEKIINHISSLNTLHGICILMKSNVSRIDAIYRFCISELLRNLHESAAKNILFCFTYSRSSFYSVGDTSETLRILMSELRLDIPLTNETMFCLDNESFRYLCTLKYENIPHKEQDKEDYAESWARSVSETKRLFNQINELNPHEVQNTLTICSVRKRILHLAEAIVNITYSIQSNLVNFNDQMKENDHKSETASNWEKIVGPFYNFLVPNTKELLYPRTVCHGEKCIKRQEANPTSEVSRQICHEKCLIKGTNRDLVLCEKMRFKPPNDSIKSIFTTSWFYCEECECPLECHHRESYEYNLIESNSQVRKSKLEKEQKILLDFCSKSIVFLKRNAIFSQADCFKIKLTEKILEEKNKRRDSMDDSVCKNLKIILNNYVEQVEKLESKVKESETLMPTMEEIRRLEEDLFKLVYYGKYLKENLDVINNCDLRINKTSERLILVDSQFIFDKEGNNKIIQ